jgi:hypothetical protein
MNNIKAMRFLKKINLSFNLMILVIALSEWIFNFINVEVMTRLIIIAAFLFIVNLLLNKIKLLNKLVLHIILFLGIITINIVDLGFFYKVNIAVIIVPPNYVGKLVIKLNDAKSTYYVKPFNKIIYIKIDSTGKCFIRSSFSFPFNHVAIAEFRNHHLVFNKSHILLNLTMTKHDSTDGKYDLFKGDLFTIKNK